MNHVLRLPQPAADDLARGLIVETRYLSPTDTRGSRIKATCKRDSSTIFSATVPFSHESSILAAHYQAALEVLRKIEAQNEHYSFTYQAVGGTERGYVFITLAVDAAR